MGMTLLELADQLRDEADAYKFLEELRWPDGEPICPHCEVEAPALLPEPGQRLDTRYQDRLSVSATRLEVP